MGKHLRGPLKHIYKFESYFKDDLCQVKIDWFDVPFNFPLYRSMISPAQCRAARALLKWKQEDLAKKASVGVSTIRTYEVGKTNPHDSTLKLLREALEKAGVVFFETDQDYGPGVRLKK